MKPLRRIALASLLAASISSIAFAEAFRPDRTTPAEARESSIFGGELAPIFELGGRTFLVLRSQDAPDREEDEALAALAQGESPRDLERLTSGPEGAVALAKLVSPARTAERVWAWRDVRVLDRTGRVCETRTSEPMVLASFADARVLAEIECDALGVEGEDLFECVDQRASMLSPETIWAHGVRTVVVEVEELGACRAPAFATKATVEPMPELAERVDLDSIPDDWKRLVLDDPRYLENQASYEREAHHERGRAWIELSEITEAHRFGDDDHVYVLTYLPWDCGGDYTAFSVLIRQPLRGGRAERIPLAETSVPWSTPDLVRRGEVIAFVGWIAPYAYGVIAPGGYEATRFAMRTWGCGC